MYVEFLWPFRVKFELKERKKEREEKQKVHCKKKLTGISDKVSEFLDTSIFRYSSKFWKKNDSDD